jgi:hypothetical protein
MMSAFFSPPNEQLSRGVMASFSLKVPFTSPGAVSQFRICFAGAFIGGFDTKDLAAGHLITGFSACARTKFVQEFFAALEDFGFPRQMQWSICI